MRKEAEEIIHEGRVKNVPLSRDCPARTVKSQAYFNFLFIFPLFLMIGATIVTSGAYIASKSRIEFAVANFAAGQFSTLPQLHGEPGLQQGQVRRTQALDLGELGPRLGLVAGFEQAS